MQQHINFRTAEQLQPQVRQSQAAAAPSSARDLPPAFSCHMAAPEAWRRIPAATLVVALAQICCATTAAAAPLALESSPQSHLYSRVQTAAAAPAVDYPKQITVFRVGEQGCYFIRIPSIIRIGGSKSSKLLALAQGRFTDGWPTNETMEMVSKLSLDDGATWGVLNRNITGVCTTCNRSCGTQNCLGSGNDPASVWDEKRSQAVVFFDTRNVPLNGQPNGNGSQIMVMTSADGVTWSKPRFAFTSWQDSGYYVGINGGPGLAAQITEGPHAGRILVGAYGGWKDSPCSQPGHTVGQPVFPAMGCQASSAVFYSDDLITFHQSKVLDTPTSRLNTFHGFYEPNPVVLPNGSVRVDLRNAGCNQQCCTGNCQQACLNPVAMKTCPHFTCGRPTPGPTVPITCFVRGFAISTVRLNRLCVH